MDSSAPDLTSQDLKSAILRHLTFTLGKDPDHAATYDWRMAMSFAIRDRIVGPWFAATRRTWAEDRKRVCYLSMEFLIGRILSDAAINLGLHDALADAARSLGFDYSLTAADEPDAALGNGGLGRLAACYLESMATLGCPAYGYGIRYEHGLFRQRFEGGVQIEAPEDWLTTRNPWEFDRPEVAYTIGFKGEVRTEAGRRRWVPAETVTAMAHDMPVIGWQGRWANTLRLWSARPTTLFDLGRFNRGDHTAAAEPEALARTLSRVLYPDDTTLAGKELRLKQEFFLTSAALQDILRRFRDNHSDFAALPSQVAIQMNDTHPAIAGPELIRLLVDDHGLAFADAVEVALATLGYTNHTLLPEALERWSTWTMGAVLPRHMQIIEDIDAWHASRHPGRPAGAAIVRHDHVHMGDLAFVTSHKVNGVSALHTDLVRRGLFPALDALHPGRIVNQTNGIAPRRWLKLANPALSGLITSAVGPGWERDLDRIEALAPLADDAAFRERFRAAKRANKTAVAGWIAQVTGVTVDPEALFDVQVKRMHEYKRQLLNIFQTIALWHRIRNSPGAVTTPIVKIFAGKAAPGYAAAKDIIRLINDVARTINEDPATGGLLKVIYPANYNVSMAERLIPAADLSEQISTAGMEASGTGNMKLSLNGALTIGTLDGANVEIRERVGADNFFLFGLTADEVAARRARPSHAREAIEASQSLRDVLMMVAEGRFSPEEPHRYHGLVDRTWQHDHFLVASDFASYEACHARVAEAFRDPAHWDRMAVLNTARMGYFSSDRAIRGYMQDIWSVQPAI